MNKYISFTSIVRVGGEVSKDLSSILNSMKGFPV